MFVDYYITTPSCDIGETESLMHRLRPGGYGKLLLSFSRLSGSPGLNHDVHPCSAHAGWFQQWSTGLQWFRPCCASCAGAVYRVSPPAARVHRLPHANGGAAVDQKSLRSNILFIILCTTVFRWTLKSHYCNLAVLLRHL